VKLKNILNYLWLNFFKKQSFKSYFIIKSFMWNTVNYKYLNQSHYKTSLLNFLILDDLSIETYINMINVFSSSNVAIYTKFSSLKSILWHIIIIKGFYYYYNILIKNFLIRIINNLKYSINMILISLKWIVIPLTICILYFYISMFYIQINFTKQIAAWYIVIIIFYLLISNFNTFLNKYRYGKFTSSIQRFWKRTGIVFWLIEGFLFLIFFYYFLNSSQEPLYMFDYSSLNQELLIQLKLSYKNMILLSLAIYLGFILILGLNFLLFYQSILLLVIISLIIFYTLFIETYQFVYIINLFADKTWVFDDLKQIWTLEIEQNNLRVKQQYFVLCLIAKYWHFIFIFISWFFFLIKSIESNNISYTLLGYNNQNLIILYLLNLMCLIQWFKYFTKKFLELTYYWFHVQYDEKFFITIINEVVLIIKSLLNFNQINSMFLNTINISNVLLYSNELNLWKFI